MQGGPAGGTGGSLESRSPVVVLPLQERSESTACGDNESCTTCVLRIGVVHNANLGSTQSA